MKRKALITGITGQDGFYLSKLLLGEGYEVHGLIRRRSQTGAELGTVDTLQSDINFHYGDLSDANSLEATVARVKPHEVYNLASQSHVKVSFEMPTYTALVTGNAPLYLLEAVKSTVPYAKFYQASTSEMFGNSVDKDGFQRESTVMKPVSPYGAAKLFAHNMVSIYRNMGMFACSGILFNHESPKRGDMFVTKKITNWVKQCKGGLCTPAQKLQLGNLDARRDWGHAEDYVFGMWQMMQYEKPDDYVLATGVTHSVRDFVQLAFKHVGIDDYENYIQTNDNLLRPEDVHHLKGDTRKARTILGWEPTHSLGTLIEDMLHD